MPAFPDDILPSDPGVRGIVATYVLWHELDDVELGGWFVGRALGRTHPPKAAVDGVPGLRVPRLRGLVEGILDWWFAAAESLVAIEAAERAVGAVALPPLVPGMVAGTHAHDAVRAMRGEVLAAAGTIRSGLWRSMPEQERRFLAHRLLTCVSSRAHMVRRESDPEVVRRALGLWTCAHTLLSDYLAIEADGFTDAGYDPEVHGMAPSPRAVAA